MRYNATKTQLCIFSNRQSESNFRITTFVHLSFQIRKEILLKVGFPGSSKQHLYILDSNQKLVMFHWKIRFHERSSSLCRGKEISAITFENYHSCNSFICKNSSLNYSIPKQENVANLCFFRKVNNGILLQQNCYFPVRRCAWKIK